MTRRVLMEGYYGRGNFGDDVLMAVTYNLLRAQMPNATISIVIGDYQRDYAAKLLPGITIEPPDRHAHYDMIVHGGGGVFFDFKTYHAGYKAIESLVRAIGFNAFLMLEKLSRSLIGKPRFTTDRRLGIGIGIGSFTPGSPRMLRSLPVLADLKALWVRDTQSIEQLEQYRSIIQAETIQGSDLAFLTDYWMKPIHKSPGTKPRLGIALRDWPNAKIMEYRTIIEQLAANYEITGFIFDNTSDSIMKQLLAPYKTHVWDPEHMSIEHYATNIAAQDVLLTSRAHGAICGACLGVPSVIVNIEPKMEQIHAMLPHASILVFPRETHLWESAIAQACSISSQAISDDVSRNRNASEQALQQIKRWFA